MLPAFQVERSPMAVRIEGRTAVICHASPGAVQPLLLKRSAKLIDAWRRSIRRTGESSKPQHPRRYMTLCGGEVDVFIARAARSRPAAPAET